ncbi:MAG: TonB family protein [Bdellovibrionales bacterium]|nr:TonB family protein [Bdellovibrionales bacterium]
MGTRIFQFSIIASLLIHCLMSASVWLGPESTPEKKKEDVIELEMADAPSLRKSQDTLGQIVDQSTSINEEEPEEANYFGAKNQKVNKETRAALTGKFKNDGGLGQSAQKVKQKTEKPKDTSPPTLDSLTPDYQFKAARDAEKESQEEASSEKPQKEGEGQGNSPALSQSDDYLPDQEKSLQTMLNTREFKYFSYYSRIKNQLNQFWEPKIKEKVLYVFRQGRRIASTKDHITRLLIVLNDKGNLVTVKVIDQSGVVELDDAAIEAFRAAAPFPNPPTGLIESDGTVKIRWDFVIEV